MSHTIRVRVDLPNAHEGDVFHVSDEHGDALIRYGMAERAATPADALDQQWRTIEELFTVQAHEQEHDHA